MRRKERTSYAFLMEMMWVCAFFLICACIFVMAFAKAEQMSRKADTKNQAVQAASNAMEELYAAYGDASRDTDDPAELEQALAPAVDAVIETYSTDDFTIQVQTALETGLIRITVTAVDNRDQEDLISLEGARAAAVRATAGLTVGEGGRSL